MNGGWAGDDDANLGAIDKRIQARYTRKRNRAYLNGANVASQSLHAITYHSHNSPLNPHDPTSAPHSHTLTLTTLAHIRTMASIAKVIADGILARPSLLKLVKPMAEKYVDLAGYRKIGLV